MMPALRIDDAASLPPMTAEEFLALDVDPKLHLELLDGELILTPAPITWHNRLGVALFNEFEEQLPAGAIAVTDMDMVVDVTGRVMRPDVLIVREESVLTGGKPWAKDTLLVVEIVSPGSTFNDRRTKPEVYAAAGLHYWRIENEQRRLVLYRHWPDDRSPDRITGKHTETIGSVALSVDLDALTAYVVRFLP
ncbi:MAG: Uma2 family endonuclease [Mycobacteriales bacterium]